MSEPLTPSVGWGVLHLFCKVHPASDGEAVVAAVKAAEDGEHQVVSFSVLGHKADLGFLAIGPDWVRLRRLQPALQLAGLEVVSSYVSLTEVSEYSQGMPEEHLQGAYTPACLRRASGPSASTPCRSGGGTGQLVRPRFRRARPRDDGPRQVRPAVRRPDPAADHRLDRPRRLRVGRHAASGSDPDDLKDTVYTMRFDEASARYAEFGPFYAGIVAPVEETIATVGLT